MPFQSKSDVSYAKHKLPYPIYAADFDPYRRGYLVVGGGGGESSTGIANQIVRNKAISGAMATYAIRRPSSMFQIAV
jgi:hypothetical protein